MNKSKDLLTLPDETPAWIKDAVGKDRFINMVVTQFNQLQHEADELEKYILEQKAEWLRDRDRLLQVQNEFMFFLGVTHGIAEIIFKEVPASTTIANVDRMDRVLDAAKRLHAITRQHAEKLSKEPNYRLAPAPE